VLIGPVKPFVFANHVVGVDVMIMEDLNPLKIATEIDDFKVRESVPLGKGCS